MPVQLTRLTEKLLLRESLVLQMKGSDPISRGLSFLNADGFTLVRSLDEPDRRDVGRFLGGRALFPGRGGLFGT